MQNLLVSPYRIKQKRHLRWRRASTQRYPGQMYDSESGLHYNGFRDQETGTGRYIQPDPIGLEGGISAYGYVSSNPLMNIDPNGLTTTTLPYSGIPITDYGNPPARPMPLPRPGPAPGLGWGVRVLVTCRNFVSAAAANPLTIGVLAAVYPSATSACDVVMNKPPECPQPQMTEKEQCYNRCYAAYEASAMLCRMVRTPNERRQCWANAAYLLGECQRTCK